MYNSVRETSKSIVELFIQAAKLPRTESELAYIMNRSKNIFKLPSRVDSVDRNQIPWKYFRITQYYYCCWYGKYTSFLQSKIPGKNMHAEAG